MNEEDIISVIKKDEWMMGALRAAKSLELQDWWICAGFIRSKIWDTLHNFSVRKQLPDVDLIYFNPSRIDEVEEKELEKRLKTIIPCIPWSVKNQARMHFQNNFPPYFSSVDAIAKFQKQQQH
nr:nucleotidyltransferase family protein [Metabacillus litoralis]